MPNWAKVVVGAVALTAAVTITVATGGAAAPLLIGVAASTVSGAAIGAITGGKQGAIDGACNGFMWGSVAALGGSVISAGVKAIKSTKAVRQGVTIGRGMKRVTAAADDLGTAIYKPLNENIYNAIGKVSKPLANKISLAHNKVWIEGMKLLKVNIYDIGLGPYTSPGPWYGMELEAVKHYAKHIIVNGF